MFVGVLAWRRSNKAKHIGEEKVRDYSRLQRVLLFSLAYSGLLLLSTWNTCSMATCRPLP
jgi:cell division protein FtsB